VEAPLCAVPADGLALLVAAADQFYSVGYHGASLSEIVHNLAATQYAYAESLIATQLHAARQAGMPRPCPDESGRAELARSIMASIVGHHTVCDLTRTEDQLRSRVTAMFHCLLPPITQQD
jgi:hypothetical protein